MTLTRLSAGRSQCTVSFSKEDVHSAEERALRELGKEIAADGFRKGNVPLEILRERLNADTVLEHALHELLPSVIDNLVRQHSLKPIIPPKVELSQREPLTITITFVEKPQVRVRNPGKIRVEKKEPKLDAKDVERMIDYVLEKHQVTKEVARAAMSGDRVTIDFHGKDSSETEIPEIRTSGHTVTIGSQVLIPGFEDALIDMKAGETKTFTLTFPENSPAEKLQGKPVTFTVTLIRVEEISKPTLTDEFAKKELKAESAAAFRKTVEESMREQEKGIEEERRRSALLELIREHTEVELAEELTEDEARALLHELRSQLEERKLSLEEWLKSIKKSPEDFRKELLKQAESRLKLRFGFATLLDERKIDLTDEEMEHAVLVFLAPLSKEEREKVAPLYAKNERGYVQMKWQKRVEKLIEQMLG